MIGQILGHYRIDSQLGAGGMGVVYRAHDEKLERMVAIKVVGERFATDPSARERLLREARTASALNHPHVCTIHEVGEADGQVFIVMEYVEGRPLSALLSEPRPTEMVVRYGIQIADAVAHAHERGVVHRDLKTGNVMITPEGRAKVLDFGLAKRLSAEDVSEQPTRSDDSLSAGGEVVGTLHYLAPEVLRGQPADARTDVWALGVLLYQLASGELPFKGHTRYEVTGAIQSEPPEPLTARVPPSLQAVIQRCLAKEPGQRYQRASEVRAALEAIQSGSIPIPAPAAPAGRWSLWVTAGVVVLLVAWGAYKWLHTGERGIQSVAVLPFANQGGDPDNEYMSDGITESVIGSLSHLPKLKMIAFGSVLRYKGRPVDAATVARDLAVDALVVGRITPRPDGLEVSAELIDARDGSRIWGDKYDAKPSTLLSVQQEISKEVSNQLRSHLSEEERRRLTKHYAENTEAYDLYLKGRHYHDKFTRAGYEKALDFFGRAIEKDPAYAPAYVGTAITYLTMTFEGYLPPSEGYPQVEAAVTKARQLDDTIGELSWPIAMLKLTKDWDWRAADKEFQRGIELDPQSSWLRRFYAELLRSVGREDEAIAQMKRAQELDPLGVEINKGLGGTYYWARRYDEAIDQLRKTLEIDPGNTSVHDLLASVYARKRMYKEAIAEQQQAFLLNGDKESAEGLAQDFEKLGFEPVMRQLNQATLDGLKEDAKTRYVSPFYFAVAYSRLGDKDEAFAWLEKAAVERSPWVTYIKGDPDFDGVRSDPRFTALLKRIGLPT